MTPRVTASPIRNHIPGLDGLRGIACLMVFFGHFCLQLNHVNQTYVPSFWRALFSQYWSGVDLFFVLSGFVIFLSLNNLHDRLGDENFFKSYFTSRAFRILAVYFLLILTYFYIPFNNRLMNYEPFSSAAPVPAWVYFPFYQSWWMVRNHNPGAGYVYASWSLCAEVFLYILSFLMVVLITRKHLMKAMAAVALISCIIRIHTVVTGGNLVGAWLLPTSRMDGFMLGGIVAVLYAKGHLSRINGRALNWALVACLAAFVLLTCYGVNLYSRFTIVFGYAFYAVFYSVVLIKVITTAFGFLSKGPLAYVGTVSYFVYLFHVPIIQGMAYVGLNAVLDLVVCLSIVFGLATLSWYTMEKPLIERGRAINRRLPPLVLGTEGHEGAAFP
jgi:peptidoglycan/LPS O-acetylase OafA/YrhL